MTATRFFVDTLAAAVLGAVVASACSAPATLRSLEEAEQFEKAGANDRALARYDAAVDECRAIKNPRLRARDCRSAHLQRAELLVTMERVPAAIRSYEAIETALPDAPTAAAEGLYRSGKLRLANGDDVGGYKQLWRCVTDYPDEQFAGDALRTVVSDGRRRNPEQLYGVLRNLASALAETLVADNVHFFLAELAEAELKDPTAALTHYDRIWRAYPKSGLFDESLWRGAALAKTLGDGPGAAARLRRLLATREVALGAGSYFSVWLDDSQLELGRILRDEVGDLGAAERAFAQLEEDYPASILRDDARFELAVTQARRNNKTAACDSLAILYRDWPDSKYELEAAPGLRRQLGCPVKGK